MTEYVQKDQFGRAFHYQSPTIDKEQVKPLVEAWVDNAIDGLETSEIRNLLPQINQATYLIVDFVMANLSEGRVDGKTIRPIAKEVAEEIKADLPPPPEPEEL